jgi:hypothetical protein
VSLTLGEAIDELEIELSYFSKVFIILDALDESNEDTRVRVLEELQRLPNLHLMLTGRPYVSSGVESIFKDPGFETLEICAQDIDVEQYVKFQLEFRPSLRRKFTRDHGLQKLILDTVVSKAQGMYV